MDNIQNIAVQTYLENLKFLESHDRLLYDRILSLSNMIEQGEYKERYHLEYIKDDKEFDIYDSRTDTYIYNKNPNEFIKKATKESNFDKKSTIDLLTPETYNPKCQPYVDPLDNELRQTTAMCMKDIFDYIMIFKKSTLYKQKKFKYFEKFMFVGTLLGTHIKPIVDKLKIRFILVYEHNIEIFRLSLFTANYAELFKNTNIIFSIMEDKTDVEKSIEKIFHYAFRSNFMLKYYCTNYNIHDFFERTLSVSLKKSPFSFTYWRMIESMLKPSLTTMLKFPTLDTSKVTNILNNQPTLILSAGPSFGKNIEWVKANQHKFFIIAVGAVVKKLIDEDIKIDLITSVDADRLIKNQFPDDIRENIKNIPFIASPNTHKTVLAMFEDKSIILLESMAAYKLTSFLVPGYTVGEVTLNTAYTLGAKEIYLLGSDLAFDQDTGNSHSEGHQHHKTETLSEESKEHNAFMKTDGFSQSHSTILVKGNFKDTVVTRAKFEMSIGAYEIILKRINAESPQSRTYNLNDGAYFHGAEPTRIKDINLVNSTNIIKKEEFINSLQEYLYVGFTNEEKDNFKDSVKFTDTIIKKVEELKKVKVKSYNEFNSQRNDILEYIKNDSKEYSRFYLDKMFINYILMTESYIGYQFNDKELKNEANLIKKVKKVWCEHMLVIAKNYNELVKPIYLLEKISWEN